MLRDSGLWACVGVGYECEFVSVGVCGENKTWTWEWMWVWCGVELSVACRVVK